MAEKPTGGKQRHRNQKARAVDQEDDSLDDTVEDANEDDDQYSFHLPSQIRDTNSG